MPPLHDRPTPASIFRPSPKKLDQLIKIVNDELRLNLPIQPPKIALGRTTPERKCHDDLRYLFYQHKDELLICINRYCAATSKDGVATVEGLSCELQKLRSSFRQSRRFTRVESDPSARCSPTTSFSTTTTKSFGPGESVFSYKSDTSGAATTATSFDNDMSFFEPNDFDPEFMNVLKSKSRDLETHRSRLPGSRHSKVAKYFEDNDSGGDTEEDEPMEDVHDEAPLSPRYMPITPRGNSLVAAESEVPVKSTTPPTPYSMPSKVPYMKLETSGKFQTNASKDVPLETNNIPTDIRRPGEHYHIRQFPKQGLFMDNVPAALDVAPPIVRYEYARLMTSQNMPPHCHQDLGDPSWHTFDGFWSNASKYCPSMFEKSPRVSWEPSEIHMERVTFSGALKFCKGNDTQLFRLTLSPARVDGTSCRFFRKFGSERFLKLIVPSSRNLPEHLQGSQQHYMMRLEEWLNTPRKTLIGSHWTPFLVRPAKQRRRQNTSSGREDSEKGNFEVFLFATEGPRLRSVSIEQLINWFIPLELNCGLPICKAFARLDLGVSQTYSSFTFKPSQVRVVPDLLADGAEEDIMFNDQSFEWINLHKSDAPNIMNDGCSLISAGAAKAIWVKLIENKVVPPHAAIPSAFQARIGPWKGVWMIDRAPWAASDDIWIEVTAKNQTKFERHLEDQEDSRPFDTERLTFEVCSWARKPTCSALSIEYLPILKDRKVPHESIRNFVKGLFNLEVEEFTQSLNDPAVLYSWLCKSFPRSTVGKSRKEGAMPIFFAEKARLLLESGFNALDCAHLAKTVLLVANSYFTKLSRSLRISIPRSTNLIGVADHLRVLAPNEVHVSFSEPIIDSRDGARFSFLPNIEVLVSRHPALRPCDIQKVRAVWKPELSHLVDVLVFPTTGSYPLAGKLQGGDYDGDRFFLCWEPALVEPFENAPVSTSTKSPEDYGIFVDRTQISAVDSTEQFLKKSFTFQLQDQLLGYCTKYHEALAYDRNSITDSSVEAVADIHDYLIDTAKNGYVFNMDSWRSFLKSLDDPNLMKSRPTPPFRKALEDEKFLSSKARDFRPDNILDDVIFNITRVEALKPISFMQSIQVQAKFLDDDVADLFLQINHDPDKKRRRVAQNLKVSLDEIIKVWHRAMYQVHGNITRQAMEEAINEGQVRLLELQPAQEVPISRSWFARPVKHIPSYWELVKASALHYRFPKNSDFVFRVAGDAICYIKAHARETPHYCVPGIFMNMKMKAHVQTWGGLPLGAPEDPEDADFAREDDADAEEDDDTNHEADVRTQYHDAFQDLNEMMASSCLTPD